MLKSALAKRIHQTLEDEEKPLPLFNSIEPLTKHVLKYEVENQKIPDISLSMCLLSMDTFKKGWHLTLIDQDAKEDFQIIKHDLEALDFKVRRNFIFRLTVWQDKYNSSLKPAVTPGTMLVLKRVHDIENYKGLLQGSVTVAECNASSFLEPTQTSTIKRTHVDNPKRLITEAECKRVQCRAKDKRQIQGTELVVAEVTAVNTLEKTPNGKSQPKRLRGAQSNKKKSDVVSNIESNLPN